MKKLTFLITAMVSLPLAACSSDVTRFDGPSYGLGGTKRLSTASLEPVGEVKHNQLVNEYRPVTYKIPNDSVDPARSNASISTPRQIGAAQSPQAPFSSKPVGQPPQNIAVTALPDMSVQQVPTDRSVSLDKPTDVSAAQVQPVAQKPIRTAGLSPRKIRVMRITPSQQMNDAQGQSADIIPAQTSQPGRHTVVVGDTLYSISRRHKISIAELRSANGLRGNGLKQGQTLVIPNGAQMAASQPAGASITKVADTKEASVKTYSVQSGETMYSIARKLNVRPAVLMAVNEMDDPSSLKVGQKLNVPQADMANVPSQVARVETKPAQAPVKLVAAPALTAPKQMAPVRRVIRPQTVSKHGFIWPVQGQIISQFGKNHKGTRNDGVNLAVPAGTSVKAAQSGVVAYAGNELKGYGNLVLVRHANNWVSAYAHNDSLSVKRGDKVRRGQIIAKAGKTGSVTSPQLHFELRKGADPVNPMKYMSHMKVAGR